jgi:hypothetical protein
MIPLNDVKHGHDVAAVEQKLYNVSTDESAAANDEVNVFLAVHGRSIRVSNHYYLCLINGPLLPRYGPDSRLTRRT